MKLSFRVEAYDLLRELRDWLSQDVVKNLLLLICETIKLQYFAKLGSQRDLEAPLIYHIKVLIRVILIWVNLWLHYEFERFLPDKIIYLVPVVFEIKAEGLFMGVI